MKKIIIRVIVVILLLIILRQMYHFIVINNVYKAVEKFRNEENKYYAFSTNVLENHNLKEEMFVKDNVVKRVTKNQNIEMRYQWRNLNTDEEYIIDLKNKRFIKYNESKLKPYFLSNIPNLILSLYHNNQFNISEFLKIKYIVPTKYEDKKCYKIVTDFETIVIDKDTYFPVYSRMKLIDSGNNSNEIIEKRYEFSVGEVTDEDVELLDLEDFEEVKRNEDA